MNLASATAQHARVSRKLDHALASLEAAPSLGARMRHTRRVTQHALRLADLESRLVVLGAVQKRHKAPARSTERVAFNVYTLTALALAD